MSENSQDNKAEIIESEIIEVNDSEDLNSAETVVIKKGGFLSFMAFLLAACALTISAYLFMQLKKQNEQPINSNWQEVVSQATQSSDQKINQLSNQIQQTQNTNVRLQEQLTSIENKMTNLQTSDGNVSTGEKYDDSSLTEQLSSLKEQLNAQNLTINQIQDSVTKENQKLNQTIQNFSQKLKEQPSQPSSQTQGMTLINQNYKYELAESFLQAAYKHLNINNDIEKGQEFLNKTLDQMSFLEGEGYQQLTEELREISNQVQNKPHIDVTSISKQVENLKNQSLNLEFNQSINTDSENSDQQESSWYDKLIVIRKIDDNSHKILPSTEQNRVLQDLINHYNLLKMALINKKQTVWLDEIASIESILNDYFSTQGDDIKSQLMALKSLNINPTLPDLSELLESLHALNKQRLFQSEEIPVESKLILNSETEKNENN